MKFLQRFQIKIIKVEETRLDVLYFEIINEWYLFNRGLTTSKLNNIIYKNSSGNCGGNFESYGNNNPIIDKI